MKYTLACGITIPLHIQHFTLYTLHSNNNQYPPYPYHAHILIIYQSYTNHISSILYTNHILTEHLQ